MRNIRAMDSNTLLHFPYILVRLRCDVCKRKGAYRLARLAEKYGTGMDLDKMLVLMTMDCPWRGRDLRKRQGEECGVRYGDLPPMAPPDLPPEPMRLRVVRGGKA